MKLQRRYLDQYNAVCCMKNTGMLHLSKKNSNEDTVSSEHLKENKWYFLKN